MTFPGKAHTGLRCIVCGALAAAAVLATAASAKDIQSIAAVPAANNIAAAATDRTLHKAQLRPLVGTPSMARGGGSFCGDGLPGIGEACDDGGNDNGDGCSEFCAVEVPFSCTGASGASSVSDPGFELGGIGTGDSTPNPFWSETTTATLNPICTAADCQPLLAGIEFEGDHFLWFGAGSTAVASVSTTVDIASGDSLSFWSMRGICDSVGTDSLVADINGITVFTIACTAADASWVFNEVSLAGLQGTGRTLTVTGTTTATDTGVSDFTNFFVDFVNVGPVTAAPSVCMSACGNGLADGTEQCDDGNTTDGDGCSSSCEIEAGFECTAPVPAMAIDVVTDPSFELGPAGGVWNQIFPATAIEPIDAQPTANTGDFVAWFGGVADTMGVVNVASVSQAVTIPAGATELSYLVSRQICDPNGFDTLTVRLGGIVVDTLDCPAGNPEFEPYIGYTVDLISAAGGPYNNGGTFLLEIEGSTRGQDPDGATNPPYEWTNFFVDDVTILTGEFTDPESSVCTTLPENCYLEDFDEGGAGDLTGWTLFNDGPQSVDWGTTDDGVCGASSVGQGNFSGGAGEAACLDSDSLSAGAINAYLCSPQITLNGSGSTLDFLYNYHPFSTPGPDDAFEVLIGTAAPSLASIGGYTSLFFTNTDQGNLSGLPGDAESLDILSFEGSAVHVCFRYGGDFDWYAHVDDVAINAASCTTPMDTDGDGIDDAVDTDDDNDGIPDHIESAYSLDPLDPSDATANPDFDSYDTITELREGGGPFDAESLPRRTLAAGHEFALVVLDSGDLVGWGASFNGELINVIPNTKNPHPVFQFNDVKLVDAGDEFTAVLKNNGTVWVQGFGLDYQPFTSGYPNPAAVVDENGAILDDIVSIAAGTDHLLMLRGDGQLFGLGSGGPELCLAGPSILFARPLDENACPGLSAGVFAISAGRNFSLALMYDGTVLAWGDGQYLGDPSVVFIRTTPGPVLLQNGQTLTDVISIDAGPIGSLAETSSGDLMIWHPSSGGAISTGLANIENFRAGFNYGATVPGSILTWDNALAFTLVEERGGSLFEGAVLELGGEYEDEPFMLIRKPGGMLRAWGENSRGQLGDGTLTDRDRNAAVPVITHRRHLFYANGVADRFPGWNVSAASGHTVILNDDSTATALGLNASGQLGDGTTVSRSRPVAVLANAAGDILTNIIEITAATNHTLALLADGTVVGWGDNFSGTLGNGTYIDSLYPVSVVDINGTPIGNIVGISAGASSFALRDDGRIYSWGSNFFGTLGNGNSGSGLERNYADFVLSAPGTPLEGIVQIDTGITYTVALEDDGTAVAWGSNLHGRLGNGTQTDSNFPVSVRNTANSGPLQDIVSVAANVDPVLALSGNGEAYAWGRNVEGGLGQGYFSEGSSLPLKILDQTFNPKQKIAAISGGWGHGMLIDKSGGVFAWGDNNSGQVGDTSTIDRSLPASVQFSTQQTVFAISGGAEHSTAINFTTASGLDRSFCAWGANTDGQSGGNDDQYTAPVCRNPNALVRTPNDEYEPDDTMATASEIEPYWPGQSSGSRDAQLHRFHTEEDVDWIVFDSTIDQYGTDFSNPGIPDSTYDVYITFPSGSDLVLSDLEITVDGQLCTAVPCFVMQDGDIFIQIRNASVKLGDDAEYEVEVERVSPMEESYVDVTLSPDLGGFWIRTVSFCGYYEVAAATGGITTVTVPAWENYSVEVWTDDPRFLDFSTPDCLSTRAGGGVDGTACLADPECVGTEDGQPITPQARAEATVAVPDLQVDTDNDGEPDYRDPDDDNDTIADGVDNCPLNANTNQANNDGDAEGDVCDPDDDNDTIADGTDNCQFVANTDQDNNDGDAEGDVCDTDDDNDTILDGIDNCPFIANTNQANNDGDAEGDVCDADDDNDTILDGVDNCPFVANTDQDNNDGDAEGDACDTDDDNDTILDGVDNCPFVANTDQDNNDGDAEGDVCDTDDDNDTILDGVDNCPFVANTDQADADEDGIGNLCDPDDTDGDGVLDFADNCTLVENADQRDTNGDGYGNACDADINNDGTINFLDLGLLKASFFTDPASPNWDEDKDFNGDSFINFLDLTIMKATIFGPPGPSGIAP